MELPKNLRSLFEKKLVGNISSIDQNGYPHAVPVWVVLTDDKIYFSTYKSSQKAKNLQRNSKCGVTIVDTPGGPYVHILGEAQIRTKESFDQTQDIVKKIMEKYVAPEKIEQFTQDRMNNPERVLVEIEIKRILRNPFVTQNPDAK